VGVLLAIAGAVYQAVATNNEEVLRPPGTLVDIGGTRLHIRCTGSSRTSDVTVILESGLSSTTDAWAKVQNTLEKSVRVCSYDRAGIGWSDPSNSPRDGETIVTELHELLDKSGFRGRLVLVGHSSGGLYVRAFAAKYPAQVAALALLDASHEDQWGRAPNDSRDYNMIRSAYTLLPVAARLGLVRLTALCRLPEDFPDEAKKSYHARCSRTASWYAAKEELRLLPQTMDSLRDVKLGTTPLVVVSAGNDPQNPPNWPELQKRLTLLSSNSTHLIVPEATHPGLLLDSAHAKRSSEAILALLQRVSRTD